MNGAPAATPPESALLDYRLFTSAQYSNALAIGDLNGDRRSDLVLASYGELDVYLADDRGRLQHAQALGIVGQGQVVIADINNDGPRDLVVNDPGAELVRTFINAGTGTFSPGATLAFTPPSRPVAVAVADLNSDGNEDVVVIESSAGAVDVFQGDGAGHFALTSTIVVAAAGFASDAAPPLAVGDVSGDGKEDIVVGNIAQGTLDVLVGHGDGTFDPPTSIASPVDVSSLVLADLDGDQLLDAASLSRSVGVLVFLNSADAGLALSGTYGGPSHAQNLAAIDVDGDCIPDLVSTSLTFMNNAALDPAAVLLHGRGDGSFDPPATLPLAEDPYCVGVGDFDGDGRADFAACTSTGIVVASSSDSARLWDPILSVDLPGAVDVDIADVTGDGYPDIVASQPASNLVSVWSGLPDGGMSPTAYVVTSPGALSIDDFNGDGRLDIAVSISLGADSGIAVLLGLPDGGFGAPRPPPPVVDAGADSCGDAGSTCGDGGAAFSCAGGDAGCADAGWPSAVDAGPGPTPLITLAPAPLNKVLTGDFTGDGRRDLAFLQANGPSPVVMTGRGDGFFDAPRSWSVSFFGGYRPDLIATGDVDGDGLPDLILTSWIYGNSRVYFSERDGGFLAGADSSINGGDTAIFTTRMPGQTGAAVVAYGTDCCNRNLSSVAVLLPVAGTYGPSNGAFFEAVPADARSGALADMDGDGIPDLLSSGWASQTLSLSRGLGGITFGPATGELVSGAPMGTYVADFDHDGAPDVALFLDSPRSVVVLRRR